MQDEISNVPAKTTENGARNVGNIFGAIIRAGLNSAPFAGGVASLWSEWDTHRRFHRIEQCVNEMLRTIEQLRDKNADLKLSDAELQLIEEVIERVQREHREEKRLKYSHLLASSLIHIEVPFDERMRFIRALDDFDEIHITTLLILRERHLAGEGAIQFTNLGSIVLGSKIGDEETESIFIPVLNTLVAEYGFVFRLTPKSTGMVGAGSTSPEAVAKRCEHVIRPLGLRFLEFLEPQTKKKP